jgi:hypothetical protein
MEILVETKKLVLYIQNLKVIFNVKDTRHSPLMALTVVRDFMDRFSAFIADTHDRLVVISME